MANTLMFEVGVSENVKNLEKVKEQLNSLVENYSKNKAIQLKVEIENLDAINTALSKIGDSPKLRELRQEIESLNREFSKLAAGAGGVGDLNLRSANQNVAELKENWQSANRTLLRYKTDLEDLRRTRDMQPVGSQARTDYQGQIATFKKTVEEQQKIADAAKSAYDKAVKDAGQLVDANTRAEASYRELKSSIDGLKTSSNGNVVGTDFANWAKEVQSVTASVRELVEQLQKMNKASTTALQSTQQLSQAEQKGTPQGGIFDPQQFKGLQEAIDAVIREINRLKEAFAGVGEIRGLSQLTESMNALFHNVSTFKDVFATLSAAVNLTPTSEYVKKLQTDFEAAQAKVQELTEKLTALAAAQNQVAETAAKAGKSEQQIGDSQTALFNRYNKLLADIQNIKREIVEIQRGAGGGGPFGDKLGEYFSSLNRIRNVAREITSSPSVADAITKGMSSEQLAKLNSALAALKTNYKEVIADAKDFNKATDKGSSQAEARIRKLGMAFNELKNYMRQNGGSEEMKRLQTEIQGAIRKMRDLMNASNFAGAINVYERLSGIIRQAASATKEFEKAQQGVSGTVSHTNSHLQNQSQILSDLKTMAMQYLSVWGAQSFINNIIELGGQLEQQRLSIGAILQDTAQANHLFGQIKDLAIRSPFGVQQLDAMTKQLSAYGFQYSELYEWTKRLADISAATGTSVDRLALALGHVRSEGALSGYTLRQFSMGNIPLLQKLSENLGKTKQEIRKMTRNKEIGYEDVLNVLKQLTDESGMFYQAQETMAEALNAKFKNLRDSFQIMYSEMAEGAPGDFLKGVAEVLTDISKSWRVLMPIILSGAGALGLWKLSTMALNHELQRTGALMTGNAMAASKYSVAQLRAIATTGRWTLALRGLKAALMSIAKFVFNPVTMGFAAIEGLVYLWSKHNEEVRKAADLTKAFSETAAESQKNLAKMLGNIEPYSDGMDDSAMRAGIDSMTEAIKNYGVNGQKTLNNIAESADTVAEKYKLMREELEKTDAVYKEMQRTADAFEYGINATDQGWGDDNVETDLTNYAEALKKFDAVVTKVSEKYGDNIYNILSVARIADKSFAEATKNMTTDAEKLAELFANLDKYQKARDAIKPWTQGQEFRDVYYGSEGFLDLNSKRKEAMRELDTFISETESYLSKHGYDFTKELAPEQVGNLLKQSKDWLEKHPEWESIYSTIEEKLEQRWPIKFEPEAEALPEQLSDWQQEIQDWLDKNGLKIQISPTDSHEDFIKKVQSFRDAAQTAMDASGKVLIGIGFKLDALPDQIPEGTTIDTPWNRSHLASYNENKNKVDLSEKLRQAFNFQWKDKSKKSGGKNPDTERAKAVREQVRVIKEAADAFQYWREKVGDKGAWEHVQAEFGDVLKKIGITADNIEDVRSHLKSIPEMKEYKAITDKKVKTEIDKEIAKENDQYIRKDFERDTERFLSKTQIELDNLTRSWETFNSVREATGDVQLAIELSGADYVNGQTQNLADALKEKIQKDFAAAGAVAIPFDINLDEDSIEKSVQKAMPKANEEQIKGIVEEYKKWRDLQRQLRDESIKAYASMVADTDSLKSKVAKVNDEYVKQIENLRILKSLGSITDEQYNIGVEKAGRTRKLGYAEALVDTTDWSKSFGIVGSILKTQARELGAELKNIITSKDFAKLDTAEQKKYLSLQKSLYEGGKTATSPFNLSAWGDLQDKSREFQGYVGKLIVAMKDLEYWTTEVADAQKEYDNAKGIPAKMTAQARLITAQQNRNDAQARVKEAETGALQTGEEVEDAGNRAVKGLNNFASALGEVTAGSLSSLVLGIGNIIKVIKGDGEMANSVGELFGEAGSKIGGLVGAILQIIDLLGEEPAKFIDDLLTKISKVVEAVISQIPQIIGSVVKGVGNIVASAVDGVGSLFGIDFGLSDLFNPDGKLQEQIEALQANNKALEANTSAILSARERTLGYDTGRIRQAMRDMYQSSGEQSIVPFFADWYKNGFESPAAAAMNEFYDKNGLNGYSKQLENLKEQRQNLLDMYDAEFKKKDGSKEALEDYKQQIAELDDQIMFFAEDLSEELFGLDLKGWADQIGDSLMTAFENGEDAAEAFNDTVQDIMRQVLRKMLSIGVIEPMMEKLRKKLFGENGKGGSFDAMNPEGTIDAAMRDVAEFFGEGGEGQKMIEASETFYKRWQQFMDSQGLSLDTSDTSASSTASGIKGITEQTADILSGYINAIRASTSNIENLSAQYFPMYYNALTSSNASLRNLEEQARLTAQNTDAIKNNTAEVVSLFNGLKNKVWKVPMA